MPKPQAFAGCCPRSSPLSVPTHEMRFLQAPICIPGWQWAFPAILPGTWFFYSLHKSKDTIKATHQRAIKGTSNSTLLWRGCYWTRQFSANSFPNAEELLLVLCSHSSLAHLRETGIWRQKHIVFLSGLVQHPTVFPFVLTYLLPTIALSTPVFLDEDREHWLMHPHLLTFLSEAGWLAFLQLIQLVMPCCLLSNRKRKHQCLVHSPPWWFHGRA